jgi:hypothetical protein
VFGGGGRVGGVALTEIQHQVDYKQYRTLPFKKFKPEQPTACKNFKIKKKCFATPI